MLGNHSKISFSFTSQGLPQDVHWCLIGRKPACDFWTLEPMLYLWMTLLPKIDTHGPWECLYLLAPKASEASWGLSISVQGF